MPPSVPSPSGSSAASLLQGFLAGQPAPASPRRGRLPGRGTLHQLEQRWGHRHGLAFLLAGLRSLGQVIFINNPLSGLLLLLGLALESLPIALFTALGIATANRTAQALNAEPGARANGIYGFNGALVGSAIGALGQHGPGSWALAWALLVFVGAMATTLVVHGLGRWLVRKLGIPPLTLPFCVVTLATLVLVMALGAQGLQLQPAAPLPQATSPLVALAEALPRGFGQVFLCNGLATGLLVLAAVAVASPLAALLGLLGGLISSLVALAMGVDAAAVGQGLWSYNGVLTSIALAGTFFAPGRRSLMVGCVGAALCSLITPPLVLLLGGRPPLTLAFVLSTMALMLLARRILPSLVPVALHAIHTPEEHRIRFQVSRDLLNDFRVRLRAASGGGPAPGLAMPVDARRREDLLALFARLDSDGNGQLSLRELAAGLGPSEAPSTQHRHQLTRVLAAMDRNGDGVVDSGEFIELMLRLQRLAQDHDRLMQYLKPLDADGNDCLEPEELNQLLRSLGQQALQPGEHRHLYGDTRRGLTWSAFVDQLLLT